MNNVTFIEITDPASSVTTEYAIIDWGNDEFTSMLKSAYEEQLANEAEAK